MRVFVTGATGFIGRALIPRLQREGHVVVAWVRSPSRARGLLGADVEVVSSDAGADALVSVLERCDAVVNLAGEPLLAGRWTRARRVAIESSRVGLTGDLVRAMARARPRPAVFVSGSAVGYYGDRASESLTECSIPGVDTLAQLCRRWEEAAERAESLGVRVVRLRTGVVLGRAGGALAQMTPAFSLGLGGPVGSGEQFLPWIHLHDLVSVVTTALVDERYQGPVNGVAPEQVTSRTFARHLGRALGRPAAVRLPAFVLSMVFGEAAMVLLSSQRVEPDALRRLQFEFEFPSLDDAFLNIVGGTEVTVGSARSRPPGAEIARYELKTATVVDAPIEEAFTFFSKAENLGLLTPPDMRFSIVGDVPPMAAGARIDYRLRVGALPLRWRTRIDRWEPGRVFVDLQEVGPYRLWWHEHSFRREGAGTVMDDRVYYTPPFGILGRLANRFIIEPMLKAIFRYRSDVIRLRFGAAHTD